MQDLLIRIHEDGQVYLYQKVIGYQGENKARNIVIQMDTFVDGVAILEVRQNDKKYYLTMNKGNISYTLPILNSMLTSDSLEMQLRITVDEETVLKSEIFEVLVENSIEATETIPEEYENWLDTANAKIIELDNFKTDLEQKVADGYFDGEQGPAGKDASINGFNAINIIAGENVTIEQNENNFIINAEGGSGGGSSTEEQDPTVPEYVKKITEEDIAKWNNKSDFSGNYEDLEGKPTIPEVPTKLSELENDSNFVEQSYVDELVGDINSILSTIVDGVE